MSQLGILRSIGDDELELMRSWRNEPAVRANMYTQHEISREEHLAWWEKINNTKSQREWMKTKELYELTCKKPLAKEKIKLM